MAKAAPTQVWEEALPGAPAMALQALAEDQVLAETSAEELALRLRMVGQTALLPVVLVLASWLVVVVAAMAAPVQGCNHPSPALPPKNQTQRRLQEQPLELRPLQWQRLP